MTDGAEQRRFLTQNWEVLYLHYLQRESASQIAGRTDKRESTVRRVLAEAWELGITYGDVHDYMQRA